MTRAAALWHQAAWRLGVFWKRVQILTAGSLGRASLSRLM